LAWFSSDYGIFVYREDGSTNQFFYDEKVYNDWNDPLTPDGYHARKYSIYAVYAGAPTAPTSLLCEGQSSPVSNVTDLTPEFSAIFNDPDSGDIANAVEIEVGTSPGGSDMWDSGWIDISGESLIEGNRCNDQSYAGSALSLNEATYYWRIRFRDDNNEEGAWSANAQFTMAAAPVSAAVEALLSQIW